jgi:hypothetical protein
MTVRRRVGACFVTLALCVFAMPCSAADPLLQRAKAYIETNDAQSAYNLLAPLENERAGDPEYDYLLGVAALDSGRSTEAVFALERVLAIQPDHAAARAQIARAYFGLKETETARREFENVARDEVPENVRQTIERYLAAIDRVSETEGFSARFFLEFSSGWDSNINSATALDAVAVPGLSNNIVTLQSGSVEQQDGFFSAGAGIAITNSITKTVSLIGGVSGYKRNHFTQDNFDTGYLDFYLGLTKRYKRDTFSLVGQVNAFFLDDPAYSNEYRDAVGGTLQWVHDFNASNQLTVYGQYAALLYPEQPTRDADRYIGGVAFAHAFRKGDPIAYVGAYGGLERARDAGFRYLGHRPLGLRLGGQKLLGESLRSFLYFGAEWRDYRDTDEFFFVDRSDRQYSVGAGVTWLLPQKWELTPQVTYLNNRSNIEINKYDRAQLFVTLRRDF